jgi:hypothetical protein
MNPAMRRRADSNILEARYRGSSDIESYRPLIPRILTVRAVLDNSEKIVPIPELRELVLKA